MKKKLKELIETSKHRLAGRYDTFLIVNENKEYGTPHDKNGYNYMTVLGFDGSTAEWYVISEHIADVIYSFDKMPWNIDIPAEYGCIRLWFDSPVYINIDVKLASVRVEANDTISIPASDHKN